MAVNTNGKKAKSRGGRGYDKCDGSYSCCRMGIFQSSSGFHENDSDRFDSGGCTGEVFLSPERDTSSSSDITFDQVLDSIRLLKEQHLRTVKQYEQLAQALLNEVKQHESSFLLSCQTLEDQLHVLIEENQHPQSEE